MCTQPVLQKVSRNINFFQNQLVLVLPACSRVKASCCAVRVRMKGGWMKISTELQVR